jgi:ABC-type uncharacterized transport system substrate-binding protein
LIDDNTLTDRRAFITMMGASVFALGFTLASPPAEAQSTPKVYRIGYLAQGSGSGAASLLPLEGFRQGLRELGWVEGQNIVIEYRYAEGQIDRLPGLAEELVRLKVDVIAASPTGAALAARNASRTIPIVGMSLTEPVASTPRQPSLPGAHGATAFRDEAARVDEAPEWHHRVVASCCRRAAAQTDSSGRCAVARC